MALQMGATLRSDARPAGQQLDLLVAATGAQHGRSIPSIDVDVARTGEGSGPNLTLSAAEQGVAMTSTSLGFPLIATTTTPDDRIIVARIQTAPNGAKWCGVGLARNTVLIYGPGAHHTAISPEGLSFQTVSLPIDRVLQTAETLKMEIRLPAEGRVASLDHEQSRGGIAEVLAGFGDPTRPDEVRPDATSSAIVRSLASISWSKRRSVDSRALVRICVDYADIVYGMPSMADLCLVAHVSERRLRQAFVDTVGLPPKRYLLTRQLSRVRDALEVGDKTTTTVTRVALEAGVTHLSRFAQRYQEIFEERPSETLARMGSTS